MVVFQNVPSWNWTIATGSFIDEFTVEPASCATPSSACAWAARC
jgi:signal transduction histidine kinase